MQIRHNILDDAPYGLVPYPFLLEQKYQGINEFDRYNFL